MNTEALQYFISVYEKKSVSSAAKDLFITPQGLSKTIKQLEMELEAELFFRGPKGMEATEYGELLYARARHICYLMEDIKKEFSIINGNKGVLNVVVTYAITSALPPDLIFGFSKLHPNTQMKLRELPDEYPVGKLFQDEIDIGFLVGHEDIENCEYELILPGEVVILASKKHRLAVKDEISIMELENEGLVLKSTEQGKEHVIVEKCLEFGFMPTVEYEIGNIATAHTLCESNGLIAVSIDYVEKAYPDDRLKLLRLKEKIPQNINLIARKREIQSKAVIQFRNYVKDYCKNKLKLI